MREFDDLKLNEKLCVSAILIDEFESGFTYYDKCFKAKDINFNNCFEVSRALYIFSNLIINKRSYNITPKIKELVKNKNVIKYIIYFNNLNIKNKIYVLIYIFEYLSSDENLKKLGFKDNIRENYKFKDLANDIRIYE